MARLPQPGGDENTWGQVLNDFLAVAHTSDGKISPSGGIADDSIPASKLQSSSITNTQLNTGSGSDGQVLTKQAAAAGGFAWTSVAGSPNATTSSTGMVQLAGDLGGTGTAATAPVISNNAITTVKINDSAVTSAKIADGTIVDGDISSSAAIAKSKLAALNIADADVAAGAAIAKSKLAALNIGDSDVNAISESKITNLTTDLASKTSVTNGGGETYFDALNSGTAKTLDLANGNVQKLTLTGNCTITLTSPATGAYRSLMIYVFQDGTGSRTITWPGSVKWGTAGAPTLSTAAGKMDKILLDTVDGGTTWYGTAGPGGF